MGRYLDTGMVSNLDVLDKFTAGYNDAGTFMPTNKGELGGERPVAVDGVEVGVADAGVFDIDKNFIRTGFGNYGLSLDDVVGLDAGPGGVPAICL